jgi:MFS transporter, DHA1 family, multidrug resistance protein
LTDEQPLRSRRPGPSTIRLCPARGEADSIHLHFIALHARNQFAMIHPLSSVSFVRVLAALILASAASVMATDLIAPSLPDFPELLATTERMAQLTVTLMVLAFALAQFLFGPLSDRYGRRPVYLVGMLGFTLFSFACALAPTIDVLLVTRIGQGIFGAVEIVVGLAIIQDLFDERDRIRALAVYGIVLSLTPAAAPMLGGYVHVYIGWRANFVIIGLAALLSTLLFWRWVPESTRPDPQALRPGSIARDYRRLLGSVRFLRFAFVEAAGMGAIFAFVTAGPFLLIDRYRVPTQHFGLYQAVMVLGYAGSSLLAARLAGRVPSESILTVGAGICGLGVVALLTIVFGGYAGAVSLTAGMTIITFGMGLVWAVAPALALDATDSRTGAAAAMLGGLEVLAGGVASAAVVALHDGSARPLAIVVGVILGGGVLLYALTAKSSRASEPEVTAEALSRRSE